MWGRQLRQCIVVTKLHTLSVTLIHTTLITLVGSACGRLWRGQRAERVPIISRVSLKVRDAFWFHVSVLC
jgi:hypothetical protein